MDQHNDDFEEDIRPDHEEIELQASQLVSGVRDYFLRNVRENGMKKPWARMSEAEQQIEIERATSRAETLVAQICEIAATGEFPVVHAIVDAFQIKDGKVTIKASGIADDESLLTLNRAGRKAIQIVVRDVEQFDKHRTIVAPEPDEPSLPGVNQLSAGFEDETAVEEPPAFDDDAEQEEGEQVLSVVEHPEEWWGGYHARMGGFVVDACPFGPRTKAAKQWREGWESADANPEAPSLEADPETGEVVEPDPEQEQEPETSDLPRTTGTVNEKGLSIAGEDPGKMADPATFEPEPDAIDELVGPADEAPADEEQPDFTDEELEGFEDQGTEARRNGFAPERCPYRDGTIQWSRWMAGYEAQREIERAQDADFE